MFVYGARSDVSIANLSDDENIEKLVERPFRVITMHAGEYANELVITATTSERDILT